MIAPLNRESTLALNAFSTIQLDLSERMPLRDMEHLEFVAKSDYGLPQISSKVDGFVQVEDMLIPFVGDRLLWDFLCKKDGDGYLLFEMSLSNYRAIEDSIRSNFNAA